MNTEIDYTIIRSSRRTMSIEVRSGQIIVKAPYLTSKGRIEAFVSDHENWIKKAKSRQAQRERQIAEAGPILEAEIKVLKERAKQYIPTRVEYYARLIGVKPEKISIRLQKTRWGSCTTRGTLNFNCLLMLTPIEVIDSVVVHELCHMKHMNHSRAFYDEIYRYFPDYDKWNKWLKKNGSVIIGRI